MGNSKLLDIISNQELTRSELNIILLNYESQLIENTKLDFIKYHKNRGSDMALRKANEKRRFYIKVLSDIEEFLGDVREKFTNKCYDNNA